MGIEAPLPSGHPALRRLDAGERTPETTAGWVSEYRRNDLLDVCDYDDEIAGGQGAVFLRGRMIQRVTPRELRALLLDARNAGERKPASEEEIAAAFDALIVRATTFVFREGVRWSERRLGIAAQGDKPEKGGSDGR